MAKRRRAIDGIQALMAPASRDAAAESAAVRQDQPPTESHAAYTEVPIGYVAPNRNNVRRSVGDLTSMVQSVVSNGILEPLVVRPVRSEEREHYPTGPRYILIMGARRHAAATAAGLTTLPVIVRTDLDSEASEREVMLIENLQREDLSPIDEALAYRELTEHQSQRSLAQRLGVTQAHISRRLTLLSLVDDLQSLIAEGRLGVDVAINNLAKLPASEQSEVATRLSEDSERAWEPAEVRKLAELAARHGVIEGVRRQQRKLAKEKDARIVEDESALPEAIAQDVPAHRIYDRDLITKVGSTGHLLAVITDTRSGPIWLADEAVSAEPSDTGGITPDDLESDRSPSGSPVVSDTAGITHDADSPPPSAVNGADLTAAPRDISSAMGSDTAEASPKRAGEADISQLIGDWAGRRRRIHRPELIDIARWTAEKALVDGEAWSLVRTWLGVTDDFATWRATTLEADQDQLARAVWLYSVAADLIDAASTPDSPAGFRTEARRAEVDVHHG